MSGVWGTLFLAAVGILSVTWAYDIAGVIGVVAVVVTIIAFQILSKIRGDTFGRDVKDGS